MCKACCVTCNCLHCMCDEDFVKEMEAMEEYYSTEASVELKKKDALLRKGVPEEDLETLKPV
jgi:hypothetical protein